jgi:hypothetical protein
VHTIPTLESMALLARLNTLSTPSSVFARIMLHTAKTSSHSRMYLSVILRLAEFLSRNPAGVSDEESLLGLLRDVCLTGKIDKG